MKKNLALPISMTLIFLSVTIWLLNEVLPFRELYDPAISEPGKPYHDIQHSFTASVFFFQLFWISLYAICENIDLKHRISEIRLNYTLKILIATSLISLVGLGACFPDKAMAFYCIMAYLGALLYLWPLRFLAIGEFAFAFLFGTVYLSASCTLMLPAGDSPYSFFVNPILYQGNIIPHFPRWIETLNTGNLPTSLSSLSLSQAGPLLFHLRLMAYGFPPLLLALILLRKATYYSYHLELQQYSFPVFLGWIFPSTRKFLARMSDEKSDTYIWIAVVVSLIFWTGFIYLAWKGR